MQHRINVAKTGAIAVGLLVAIGLRVCWLSQQRAAEVVIHGSYWVLIGLVLWLAWLLAKAWHARGGQAISLRQQGGALAVLAALTVLLQVHEPHLLKVNYDEHVLVGISRSMHYEHLAAWPGGAHLYFGTVTPTSLLADKRPVFFPFLLSLFHTLTGYRVENVFVLNGVVSGLLLLGAYLIGRVYQPKWGGVLFAALLAGVPLVAQCATGGGFDLLNVTLMVLLAFVLREYLAEPSSRKFELLTLVTLLLGNTRYESLAYTAVPVVAFLAVWRQTRVFPEFPSRLVLAPLGLVPPLLSNAVFNSSETFFQAKDEAFWAWSNLPHNLEHAVYYLLDPSRGGTNSVWLAVLGVLALAAVFFVLRRQRSRSGQLRPESCAFVIIGSIVALNALIMLGLRWGEWNDPLVSRFSLPVWLLFGWAVLECCRHVEDEHGWRVTQPLTYLSLAIVVLFAAPDASQARQTHKLNIGTGLAWSLEFLKKHDPQRTVFVLANSAIPYINEGYAAVPLDKSLVRYPGYAATLHYGLYQEVLIVMEETRDRSTGDWVTSDKAHEIVTQSKIEILSRMTIDPFYRITILRVLGTKDDKPVIPWPGTDEDVERYRRRVYELMP